MILNLVIVLTALANLGVSITGLVAAFSAAAVAVSLALKDSLSNIAAGIVMLLTQPFSTNDFIELQDDGVSGKVLRIDIVHTTLLTADSRQVIIPNGQLVNKTVINYSKEEKRRLDLNFGISYKSDINKAKEVIAEVVNAHKFAMNDPEPFIRVSAHNESSVVITVRVWCKSENYWSLNFDLLEQVRESFDKNGIEIPYNQLDVRIVENKDK